MLPAPIPGQRAADDITGVPGELGLQQGGAGGVAQTDQRHVRGDDNRIARNGVIIRLDPDGFTLPPPSNSRASVCSKT